MQILVVDNEVEVARVLADALSIQGHTAILAHSGRSALEIVGRERPDAVFLDLVMPDLTGLDVLRRLRALDQSLPVVIVTAHGDSSDLDEVRALGITEVIEKPAVLKNLEVALEALSHAPDPP